MDLSKLDRSIKEIITQWREDKANGYLCYYLNKTEMDRFTLEIEKLKSELRTLKIIEDSYEVEIKALKEIINAKR